jgi:hypothetical protein
MNMKVVLVILFAVSLALNVALLYRAWKKEWSKRYDPLNGFPASRKTWEKRGTK